MQLHLAQFDSVTFAHSLSQLGVLYYGNCIIYSELSEGVMYRLHGGGT